RKELDIFNAIKFGDVLENVVFDEHSREVDYIDKSVTGQPRCHLLTTSWSIFVRQKNLVWGDAILFL
ncbi:hypothetical protein MKW98_025479, partial [Papaver atlanticum]